MKQRHTAVRIRERLRDEHGYRSGTTLVREYVNGVASRQKEVFMPLAHSDACFVKATPTEDMEAFLDGHLAAFAFLGGMPQSILYDNTRIAVAKILGDGQLRRTQVFAQLQSYYLFDDKFGRPAKGNDKGKVEGLVGYSRRHFMVPMPVAADFAALNVQLLDGCLKRQRAARSIRDYRPTARPRPGGIDALAGTPHDASHEQTSRVSSQALVRYCTNDYSVPTQYGHQAVLVKGTVDRVDIYLVGKPECIAHHCRSYAKADFVMNPLHYLALLEKKPHALDQAAPLQEWVLPAAFERLRRLLGARMDKRRRKEYIQVLRLLETFSIAQVEHAIVQAHGLGVLRFDTISIWCCAPLSDAHPSWT